MHPHYLEIACFNEAATHIAARNGASRIELCADAQTGGTTPNIEAATLKALKAELRLPVFVMIRPRGGDFNYTEEEYETMKLDITRLSGGADGFVFGILDPNNQVDIERNRSLIIQADGKPCTMHRAIDSTGNVLESLEKAIKCGFSTILSSGGATDALTGASNLSKLVHAAGQRIEVMPGGGIRSQNIQDIKAATGAKFFHSAAKINTVDEIPDPTEIKRMRNIIEKG